MVNVTDILNLQQVYKYQTDLQAPCFFPVDFESWKESFENDVDGEGRRLFRELHGKAVYEEQTLIGFIQYGYTAFGFDDKGEISMDVSYPVIRSLFFDEGRVDAGKLLLQEALQAFTSKQKVYAFFHYFGMSCFAWHGKLFEKYGWIQALLYKNGFETEHENVYYSAKIMETESSEIEVGTHPLTKGNQQSLDFIRSGRLIGGCKIHYLNTAGIAYLRWIYINEDVQNRGIGSKCMAMLKQWLHERGIQQLDTDTALTNSRAQHYYEKNGFIREGITRSFFRSRQI